MLVGPDFVSLCSSTTLPSSLAEVSVWLGPAGKPLQILYLVQRSENSNQGGNSNRIADIAVTIMHLTGGSSQVGLNKRSQRSVVVRTYASMSSWRPCTLRRSKQIQKLPSLSCQKPGFSSKSVSRHRLKALSKWHTKTGRTTRAIEAGHH